MKRKVHYSILEDMKKYVKDFNLDDYEEDLSYTDKAVLSYLQDYYDKNLPVDVTAWIRVNEPKETLIYRKAQGDQVCFVRDVINARLVFADKGWNEHDEPMVISHHYSKSVKLPVFQITRGDLGIEFVLRCNIYDWKISVKSEKPLDFDFMGLFDPKEVVNRYCCEGFPEDKIYGSYEQNNSVFILITYFSSFSYFLFLTVSNFSQELGNLQALFHQVLV